MLESQLSVEASDDEEGYLLFTAQDAYYFESAEYQDGTLKFICGGNITYMSNNEVWINQIINAIEVVFIDLIKYK
jgi:hypothetical protein